MPSRCGCSPFLRQASTTFEAYLCSARVMTWGDT
jgi:hypothetical protein